MKRPLESTVTKFRSVAEMLGAGGDIGAGGPSDVHHGVVNGIADRAHVFLGRARGGADDARFDERDPQRGKQQNAPDKENERHGIANGRKPRSSDRSDQKVRRTKNEVGHREGAAKPQLVRHGPAEDGQEPNHASENSRERPGLLRGEIEFFLEVQRERGERSVVGEALEDFRNVGHPERALETVADFLEPLAKAHGASGDARRDDSRGKVSREGHSGQTGSPPPRGVGTSIESSKRWARRGDGGACRWYRCPDGSGNSGSRNRCSGTD